MSAKQFSYSPLIAGVAEVAGVEEVRSSWGWFLTLGIVFIVLGVFCVIGDVSATFATVLIFGWMLMISGVFALVYAFRTGSYKENVMQRMLVVVLDNESKAYEASRALNQLDREGSISIHAECVISKNADGTVQVKEADGDYPIRTVSGTAIGSLIGLLGGPVGLGIGAVAGALAGSIGDFYVAGVNAKFLGDVSATLTPGKCAVVADVSEEWVTPVDSRMDAVGGVVFRTPKTTVEDDQRARDVAELKVEIAQLKAEHAQARADRKAKLQAKIDALNAKLQEKLNQAKQRSEQIKAETEAKVQALQNRAAKAQGDAKAAFDTRAAQVREAYEERSRRLKGLAAGQLRRAAVQLEK